MGYFTKDFILFLKELNNNNNREWFAENKKRYEQSVKTPFENFIQDMIFRIQEDDENLMITPKEAIFRIYRDIRFSKDKTPYKTHVSAVIVNGGRKNYTDPGIYLELNSKVLRFYGGIYQMTKEQLQNVRNYIASNLNEFASLQKDKKFKKYFGGILGEKNKRIPKEFTDIVEIEPLIANKQFYYFSEMEINKILSNSLTKDLMKIYSAVKPMNRFLKQALN